MKSDNLKIFESLIPKLRSFLNQDYYLMGQELLQFEAEFASFAGVSHFLGVANGTLAMEMLLQALKPEIGDRGKIITTAFCPLPTAMSILHSGYEPVFADIEADSMNLDPESVDQMLTQDTIAIMPVHIFGRVCNMHPILQLAKARKIAVVEDACQAVGAKAFDYVIASASRGASMSFYPTKNLGGFGDGGGILTQDQELHEKLFLLRNYGYDTQFTNQTIGSNYRLDDLQALILSAKLKILPEMQKARNTLAGEYQRHLPAEGFLRCQDGEIINNHVIPYLLPETKIKESMRQKFAQAGLRSRFFYDFPVYGHRACQPFKTQTLPVVEDICLRIINLPTDPLQAEKAIEILRAQ